MNAAQSSPAIIAASSAGLAGLIAELRRLDLNGQDVFAEASGAYIFSEDLAFGVLALRARAAVVVVSFKGGIYGRISGGTALKFGNGGEGRRAIDAAILEANFQAGGRSTDLVSCFEGFAESEAGAFGPATSKEVFDAIEAAFKGSQPG